MKRSPLPRLTRGQKTARNLLAALLLLVFIWGCMDFPIGDPYRSFRRAEREEMVGPSTYLGGFHTGYDGWAVGVYEGQVLLHREDDRGFEYWPRAGSGPAVLPVPENRLLEGEAWLVGVDVPEGAASARLELTLSAYYTELRKFNGWSRQICATLDVPGGQWRYGTPRLWERTYEADGMFLKEGGVLFHVTPYSGDDGDIEWNLLSYVYEWDIYQKTDPAYRAVNVDAEAVFYDEAGAELGRAALGTPG